MVELASYSSVDSSDSVFNHDKAETLKSKPQRPYYYLTSSPAWKATAIYLCGSIITFGES